MDEARNDQVTPVAENLRGVSEGISRLVKEHVELAKVEVQSSVKKLAFDASLTAAGGVLLLLGWLLLMFAIGYGLGDNIGQGRAFLIIAGVHVVVGFALVAVFASRMKTKDKPNLQNTNVELQRDRHFLHRVGEIIREEPREPRPT